MGYRTKFGTDLISSSLLYVTPASGVVLDRGPRPTGPRWLGGSIRVLQVLWVFHSGGPVRCSTRCPGAPLPLCSYITRGLTPNSCWSHSWCVPRYMQFQAPDPWRPLDPKIWRSGIGERVRFIITIIK